MLPPRPLGFPLWPTDAPGVLHRSVALARIGSSSGLLPWEEGRSAVLPEPAGFAMRRVARSVGVEPLPVPRVSFKVGFADGRPNIRFSVAQAAGAAAMPPERPRRDERKVNDARTAWVVRALYSALRQFGRVTEVQDFIEAIVWNTYVPGEFNRDGSRRLAMAAVRREAWAGTQFSDSVQGAYVNGRSYYFVLKGIAEGRFEPDLEGVVRSLVANHYADRAIGKARKRLGKGLDMATGDRRRFGGAGWSRILW